MRVGITRCPTCGQKRRRTAEQNARYWKLLRELERVDGEFTAEQFHEYFKRRFLPMLEMELPDMTTMLIPTSTADLEMHRDPDRPDKPNWDDYMQQVEVLCAERGAYLQEGL